MRFEHNHNEEKTEMYFKTNDGQIVYNNIIAHLEDEEKKLFA